MNPRHYEYYVSRINGYPIYIRNLERLLSDINLYKQASDDFTDIAFIISVLDKV